MKCKIQVKTSSGGYFMHVTYIKDGETIHRDLLRKYDPYPYPDPVVKEVVREVYKYKYLGIDVEIDKDEDINNMCNLRRLLKALEL